MAQTSAQNARSYSMPKCAIFEHGVTIGPTGAVRPCCAFEVKRGHANLYWDDDWETRHAEWGKRSETEWLDECEECKLSEELRGISLRKTYNKQFENAVGIKHWDLKINNTCNFACRMCDPGSSSTWASIVRDNKDENWVDLYANYRQPKWHKQALDFGSRMVDAKIVKFTGGEPFMIPQVKKIIEQLIEEDVAPAIELHLITNGSHDMTAWNHYFEKFKTVHVNISIEATGKRYEYIRTGSSWLTTSQNTVKFNKEKPKNTDITVTVLPMVFNRNNITDVVDWCKEHDIECSVSTPVIHPDYMRPDALEDEELKKTLVEQSEIMDKIHGTNYKDFI